MGAEPPAPTAPRLAAGLGPGDAPDPLRRRIIRASAGLLALLLVGAGLMVEGDLRRTAQQATVARETAASLARQVERALGSTLLTIAAVEEELRGAPLQGEPMRARLRALLARAADDQHLVLSYGVLDPEGRVIATSTGRVPPGTSLAGRPSFDALLAAPPGGIAVSPPVTGVFGLVQDRPIFSLGRRLLDEGGAVKAVVAATISIPYLSELLGILEVLGKGRAELFAMDGTRLATSAARDGAQGVPRGLVPPPPGAASWAVQPPEGRAQTVRGPQGEPALLAWSQVEGFPLRVQVTMPSAGLWLGLSRAGLLGIGFVALLGAAVVLGARLLLREAEMRHAVQLASARRLAVLAGLASELQCVIQVRPALTLVVAAVQRLFPQAEVLAVLMPEDGAEEVVHGPRAPGGPARRSAEAAPHAGGHAPAWLSVPLRGDAGEYIGALEVFGCDPRTTAPEDQAALRQVAALGEAALRRGRLLMHLSAAAADAEAARAELERICDTIHDGFCALDRAGRFTYANPAAARLLAPGGGALSGRPLTEVLPADAAPLAVALAAGRTYQAELPLLDGRVAALRLVPTGKGFALFLRDLTMAREVEQLRQTAERLEAVGVLTGGVAHDFNNLLTVVIGNAEALVDSLEDRPELAHSAGMILGAAERGAALIRRMMAFARRQPLSPAPTQVAGLVEDLVPLLQQSLRERVRLLLRLASGLPPALVDPAQLEAALLNLAINARDAMPQGGTLRIELSAEELDAAALEGFQEATPGRFLRVAVSDDGVGMPPEVAQRAFEPFFTTKGPGAGSGLGLASVYGFVRQSRGRIALETAPGRGTSVVLHLPEAGGARGLGPLAPTPPEAAPPREAEPCAEAEAAPAGAPLHVLVVEDEEPLRAQIGQMLREIGHEATLAAQGEAALALLREGLRPDVLLSDVVLPGGMDGAAVMREAQALCPGLPVILMSGFAARLYDASGALPPGLRLLEKPFRRQELARRLEAAAEARGKEAARGQLLPSA